MLGAFRADAVRAPLHANAVRASPRWLPHAPPLLLESSGSACRRADRPSRLASGRGGPLGRAAGDRAERRAAQAARARHRRAARHLRERELQLSGAVVVGADRAGAARAAAFAVRAGPAGLALLPAAVARRRQRRRPGAVARLAAPGRLPRRGRRADALRTRAPPRLGVRPLPDLPARMAGRLARRRFDRRARRPARARRRGRARRRAVAGGAVARAGGRAGRGRRAPRAPLPARGAVARARPGHARRLARRGQRVRAADHAAAARRAAARAVALDRRADLRAQSVQRILVRHRHRRTRRIARRGRAARLPAGRPSAAGRMGPPDPGAAAHAARADRDRRVH